MNVHLSTFWARHPALVAGLKTVLMTSTGLELAVARLVIELGLHLTTPMEQAKVNGTVPRYIMKEAEESCHGSCLGLKSSFFLLKHHAVLCMDRNRLNFYSFWS